MQTPAVILRLHQWLSVAPPHLRDEDADVYGVANYSMLLALSCHALFIGIFWLLGVYVAAVVNVGSVAIFVTGLNLSKRGFVNLALLMGSLEVIAHGWMATLMVGWAAGFHFLIILAIVVLYLFQGIPVVWRTTAGLVQIVAYCSLAVFASQHVPGYPLAAWQIHALAVMNITILLVVLMGICYYYAYAVGSARRALRSQNRQLEEALRQLHQAQDQVVAQQKLAHLGTLTAGIAHEIRNPLNFINSLSELTVDAIDELRESLPSPTDVVKETLDLLVTNANTIHQHGLRADRVVQSMLLHAGTSSGAFEPTDLNALVMHSVNLARATSVDIATQLDPELPPVPVAPRDVARAFLNLIGNAVKATARRREQAGDGGYRPEIVLTTGTRGDMAVVRVRDNGFGIEPSIRDKIFLPFFTTQPGGEGTGLGLSITHDIVVGQHRGRLTVDSKAGEHAEFIVELPLRQQGADGPRVE